VGDPIQSRGSRSARRRRPSAWRPLLSLTLGLGFVVAIFVYLLRLESGGPLPGLTAPWVPEAVSRERFAPLRSDDEQLLQEQRQRVATLARRHVGASLAGSLDDLRVLQQVVDRAPLDPEETFALQALGVALGDVMAAELGLHWVAYRDELGRSRALRLGDTELAIFPVTMISKRVERGVPFRIEELYRKTAEEIARYRREHRAYSE